jgi:hypothetical protein
MLPKNHILRKTYASEFSKDTVLSSYGALGKPAKRTRSGAIESATRALKKPKNKEVAKEESFLSISTFTKRLSYHVVTKHCMIDIAHTIANMVIVKLGAGGKITLYNNAGNTPVLVDVVGWFAS